MEAVKTAQTAPDFGSSVSLAMLKDKVQRREIAQRVKALRERSGFKQKEMATKLHVTLRQYQHYEFEGIGDYERCEQIAKIHWRLWAKHDPEWNFVSAGWIWDGKDRRETVDLMRQLNGSSSEQLDRIEAKLDEILRNWDARWALLEADETVQETSQAAPQSVPGSASTERRRRVGG